MAFEIKHIFPTSPKHQPVKMTAKFKLFPSTTYTSKEGFSIESPEVINSNATLKQMFHDPVIGEEPELSICVFEDCYILPHGVIVTKDNAIVAESLFPYSSEPWITRSFEPVLSLIEGNKYNIQIQNVTKVDEPLFHLREHGEAGYFHWMHSVLPKLGLLNFFSHPNNIKSVCRLSMPFQKQTLDMLNLEERHFYKMNTWDTLFCRTLYYATPLVTNGEFWKRPKYASRYLRSFANQIPDGNNTPERIYISRKDAGVRRLANEEEVFSALKPYGFVSVELSALPLMEQIQLIKGAKVILSAHGAGLANIPFADKTCQVIEIISPSRLWPTYRAIATRNEQPYAFVLAKPAENERPGHFDVDVDKVIKTLESLGIKK